jgi:subtilisin family serine protease
LSGSSLSTDPATTSPAALDLRVEGWDMDNVFEDNEVTNTTLDYVDGKGYQVVAVLSDVATNAEPGSGTTAAQFATLNAEAAANPDNLPLAGKILAVQRGVMNFADMADEAVKLGAGALFILNNRPSGEELTSITHSGGQQDFMPMFTATSDNYQPLKDMVDSFDTVYIDLGAVASEPMPKNMASFSSIGPVTETAGIKPDITAPGVSILSTLPADVANPDHNTTDYKYAYTTLNGTSMATPHIAGIAALMKQKYPNATPAEIKARLMNTADPDYIVPDGKQTYTQMSVYEQGAGFVDPYRAIEEDTDAYVTVQDAIPWVGEEYGEVTSKPDQTLSSLNFGETAVGVKSKVLPVTIHNTGSTALTFTVTPKFNNDTVISGNATDNNVTLQTSLQTVTVPAGETAEFDAWIESGSQAAQEYYEGYLQLASSDNTYVLPFAVQIGEPGSEDFEAEGFIVKPLITSNDVYGYGKNDTAVNSYSNQSTFALDRKSVV